MPETAHARAGIDGFWILARNVIKAVVLWIIWRPTTSIITSKSYFLPPNRYTRLTVGSLVMVYSFTVGTLLFAPLNPLKEGVL
jgi:hypothetical protein